MLQVPVGKTAGGGGGGGGRSSLLTSVFFLNNSCLVRIHSATVCFQN